MISVGFYFLSPCSRDGRNDKYDESFTAINFYLFKKTEIYRRKKYCQKNYCCVGGIFYLCKIAGFSMIKTKEKKKVGRMSRFLRFCAFLSVLFFTGNLMAAGYTCSTTGRYTSCKEGYYMSDCGSTAANWTGQTVSSTNGNSCIACPDGYACEGGNVCPVYHPRQSLLV